MSFTAELCQIVFGLLILTVGAECLVAGASALAARLGVSRLLIGLTVVSFGTSAPELTVSVLSAARGATDVSIGNVVGSNIFNVLAILGISACIAPLRVNLPLLRIDIPVMIAVSGVLWMVSLDGILTRNDGLLLLILLIAYLVRIVRSSEQEDSGDPLEKTSLGGNIGKLVFGLAFLILGTQTFLGGATALARGLGVSELVIGLTIVAAGTSLPEAATSVLAAWRGETDIALGNIVGSNIFNILAVLSASVLVAPQGLKVDAQALGFDLPFMVATSAACLPVAFTGQKLDRFEGALFALAYLGYVAYLVNRAGGF